MKPWIFNEQCLVLMQNTNEVDDSKRHDIPRHRVEKVICSLCDHEQDVKQVCENCGVCMGEYFCTKCKFFDDEVSVLSYPNARSCEKLHERIAALAFWKFLTQ
ncbi:hypothetical protein KC19_9G111100 [Ceratodon purpureus]|uniref:CHY-type domain-containing protein n=1 Tax=Ceratodon purpureus TaxID=3225 RepID=A0A8T0GV60_CERPU|nr:hypothetical protein KC19_9G111100 [Ceratodon purpureus]